MRITERDRIIVRLARKIRDRFGRLGYDAFENLEGAEEVDVREVPVSPPRRDWSTCSFARATRSDARRVAELLVDAYQTWTALGLNPKAATYTAADVEADLRSKEIWLLEGEGRLLGTATLKLWGQGASRYVYVTHVATPTSLQSQGIGTEVMRRVEAEARGRGAPPLHLDTAIEMKDLMKFYVDRGFVPFGEPFKWSPTNTYTSQKYRKNTASRHCGKARAASDECGVRQRALGH